MSVSLFGVSSSFVQYAPASLVFVTGLYIIFSNTNEIAIGIGWIFTLGGEVYLGSIIVYNRIVDITLKQMVLEN